MAGVACCVTGGFLLLGSYFDLIRSGDYYKNEEFKVIDVVESFGHIGIAMFSFEGNGVILNLNNDARDKKRYPKILTLAIITVVFW